MKEQILDFCKKNKRYVALAAVLVLCIAGIMGTNRYMEYQAEKKAQQYAIAVMKKAYQQAIILMVEENYSEAKALLDTVEDEYFTDASGLAKLCQAHISYEAGSLAKAYSNVRYLELSIESKIIQADLAAFKAQVAKEYEAYQIEEALSAARAKADEESASASDAGTSESKNTSSFSSGSINASIYSHPDDLYYDYYDDFYDYEDAEEYWEANH